MRLFTLLPLIASLLALLGAGQPVQPSDTDADVQAADEAMKIADQVSQESDAPPEDAVASDADLRGVEELGESQGTAASGTASEMATAENDVGDMSATGELEKSGEFVGAQLGNTPRLPGHAKLPALSAVAHKTNHTKHSKKRSSSKKADKSKKQTPEQAAIDAANAHTAAETAAQAAKVATRVAQHSVHLTEHAKYALKSAKDALHKARADTHGLTTEQKASLQTAEEHLKEATKQTEYGSVQEARYAGAEVKNQDLGKLQEKLDKGNASSNVTTSELSQMREELKIMREKLENKTGRKAGDGEAVLEEEKALMELEEMIKQLEEEEAAGNKTALSHDELKVEVEKLHDSIDKLEVQELEYTIPEKEVAGKPPIDELPAGSDEIDSEEMVPKMHHTADVSAGGVTPLGGMDVDTQMPYGDLEPFGREDTAQELTEASIQESDAMVDQLERAEVAEEKRAVFRALTRLRGAAITSFDGVARSQTGNIDEYNKIHKWRTTHPLHHLADEESDISKWAFPDNADF